MFTYETTKSLVETLSLNKTQYGICYIKLDKLLVALMFNELEIVRLMQILECWSKVNISFKQNVWIKHWNCESGITLESFSSSDVALNLNANIS